MPKVRTTMMPDTEIEVSDQEYLDLKRQGLIRASAETETPDIDRELEAGATTRTRTAKPKGDDK